MARQAVPAPKSKEVAIREDVVKADFALVAQLGAQEQAQLRATAEEDLAEICDLAGGIHAYLTLSLVKTFASASQVQLFKRIRESKKIKDLPIRLASGEVKRFDSIKDACPVIFGRTYQSMLDAEERYALLGDRAYEIATRLRLNESALRAVRALPPEKLEIVRVAIAGGSAKAEVLAVIEDLAEQVEKAHAEIVEAKAEKDAGDQLLQKRNAKIDTLERKLKRIEKLPPDEVLGELQKEATAIVNDARGCIVGGLRQALFALSKHGEADHTVLMAGLVGQVQADLTRLREEFDLPDVSNAADAQLAAEVAQWSGDKK